LGCCRRPMKEGTLVRLAPKCNRGPAASGTVSDASCKTRDAGGQGSHSPPSRCPRYATTRGRLVIGLLASMRCQSRRRANCTNFEAAVGPLGDTGTSFLGLRVSRISRTWTCCKPEGGSIGMAFIWWLRRIRHKRHARWWASDVRLIAIQPAARQTHAISGCSSAALLSSLRERTARWSGF
jgi:hypothetical protein